MSPTALYATECLPTIDELDSEPLEKELSKAIDSLASGKAPGNDGIPADLIKHCKTIPYCSQCLKSFASSGKKKLYHKTRGTPRSLPYARTMARGTTVTTLRHRPIVSIIGKVFARVILIRLQKLVERIYPESQCGFRAERSTLDMVVSLRQLQEKCRE